MIEKRLKKRKKEKKRRKGTWNRIQHSGEEGERLPYTESKEEIFNFMEEIIEKWLEGGFTDEGWIFYF